jgi:hypothetical protein
MVRVWCPLVLWNRVQYLRVGGVFLVACWLWWCGGWKGNFRTLSRASIVRNYNAYLVNIVEQIEFEAQGD